MNIVPEVLEYQLKNLNFFNYWAVILVVRIVNVKDLSYEVGIRNDPWRKQYIDVFIN